jgi:tRNA(fMet)-specific endonuclease VapC
MSLRYLLDTNTVSYVILGAPPAVRVRLLAVPPDSMAISAFTRAEMIYGLARKPEARRLRLAVEGFLHDMQVLDWNAAAADVYGRLRAAQERAGRRLSHEDLIIASHALAAGLTLVTSDHVFSSVKGLRTEDWTIAD